MSKAGGEGANGRAAVRVVIISTQYIETDAANFKSVVQRLTGKDSPGNDKPPPPRSASEVADRTGRVMVGSSSSISGNTMNLSSSSMNISSSSSPSSSVMLTRGLSLSDLDRLHTLPSWEEIAQLCM